MDIQWQVLVLHLVIYIGVMLILNQVYFKPVLQLLRKRDALTTGRKESSQELLNKMEDLKSKYAAEMNAVKTEVDQKKHAALKEVRDEAAKKIEDVKLSMDAKIKEHQEKINAETEVVRQKLPDIGSKLGDEMIEAIMTAKVSRA